MLTALWIVNVILALGFLAIGVMKASRRKDALASSGMAWAGDSSVAAVKAIGALEVLGALGLILPLVTGIAPTLSPLAAIGLTVLMASAIVVHLRREENFMMPAVLLILAVASVVLGFLNL